MYPSNSVLDPITKLTQYIEDDLALPLTADLSLVEVDSNIASAELQLSGLLNGRDDTFTFDQSLLNSSEVTVSEVDGVNYTRTVTLTGNVNSRQFEMVSLYSNPPLQWL